MVVFSNETCLLCQKWSKKEGRHLNDIENNILCKSRQHLTLSDKALRLSRNLGQKSLNKGLSIFFKLSLVLASTLTYSWVTGTNVLEKDTFNQSRLHNWQQLKANFLGSRILGLWKTTSACKLEKEYLVISTTSFYDMNQKILTKKKKKKKDHCVQVP